MSTISYRGRIMAKTAHEVYGGIKAYIDKKGGRYPVWYVGIASDARNRLFIEHNVSEVNGIWVYDQCTNNQAARDAEAALLNLGCEGGGGGGDQSSTYVYAYFKTPNTKP
jgi:hypothetical protein